jgi:hypothetical protein
MRSTEGAGEQGILRGRWEVAGTVGGRESYRVGSVVQFFLKIIRSADSGVCCRIVLYSFKQRKIVLYGRRCVTIYKCLKKDVLS